MILKSGVPGKETAVGKSEEKMVKLEFSFSLIFGLGLTTQLHLCLIHL